MAGTFSQVYIQLIFGWNYLTSIWGDKFPEDLLISGEKIKGTERLPSL